MRTRTIPLSLGSRDGRQWHERCVHIALTLSFLLSPADFRDLYTKVLEEEAASISSADTGQACGRQLEGVGPLCGLHTFSARALLSAGLCSEACLFRLARCPSPKLLRARSAEKRRPVPTFQKVPLPSGPAPAHSLGDLKGSWPGRGLVTRFLQLSRKSPDPTGTAAHGHKQVSISGAKKHHWESLALSVGPYQCPLLCPLPGAQEPMGTTRSGEPSPSQLW